MPISSVSIAIAGYGGTGVITTGQLLLKAASHSGYFGLLQRSFGPQIRGGESLALLRLATVPVRNQDDYCHLLVLLDTEHFDRFRDEVPLRADSLVVVPESATTIPSSIVESGAQVWRLPFLSADVDVKGGENIVATALVAGLINLPQSVVDRQVTDHLQGKQSLAELVPAGLSYGWQLASQAKLDGLISSSVRHLLAQLSCRLPAPQMDSGCCQPEWLINGSDALAFGALEAGVRFVAAYPITPATGVLEWLAAHIESVAGSLVQAEDELAAINMLIGASFGGVPSLTATSGPGLSLMSESLGLAVASETPLVVINVMRGGPSTGIPTKSEQSDLNIALHGLHGDAPHVVVGALSISDGVFCTAWSVWLAERLQVPVITLSDQSMAQSDACLPSPPRWEEGAQRLRAARADTPYQRYALTESGISPMSIPGEVDMMYTADGLEHSEQGIPSAAAQPHRQQLEKRAHKLAEFDYGEHWAEVCGGGDTTLLCWGSVSPVVLEAAERLAELGQHCQVIAIRLLAPLQVEKIQQLLSGCKRLLVVEQSHSAQFYHWLKSHLDFPVNHHHLALPGPLPIRPCQIVAAISHWSEHSPESEHAANC